MGKQEKIVSMFNDIAGTYDVANRVLSMGIDKSWRNKACKLSFDFYGKDKIPAKMEPGNANYELSYASGAIVDYLVELGSRDKQNGSCREKIERAFTLIADHETNLCCKLLDYLRSRNDCNIIGIDNLNPKYKNIEHKILKGETPKPGSYRGRVNNEPENNRKTLMDLKNA
mgnify:CR=1 FL=1